ncbi:MAG: hypothetical protein ACOX55_04785 [Christensenellales bacterium]|jgi:hypothetical protein
MKGIYQEKPKIANLGIWIFYQSLENQDCECTQIEWTPPYSQDKDIEALLDEFL